MMTPVQSIAFTPKFRTCKPASWVGCEILHPGRIRWVNYSWVTSHFPVHPITTISESCTLTSKFCSYLLLFPPKKKYLGWCMYPIKNDLHRKCGHVIVEYIYTSIGPVSNWNVMHLRLDVGTSASLNNRQAIRMLETHRLCGWNSMRCCQKKPKEANYWENHFFHISWCSNI